MFDSFVNSTVIIFWVDTITFDNSQMIIDAVDVAVVIQIIFMIDVDLFRNRFSNGFCSHWHNHHKHSP